MLRKNELKHKITLYDLEEGEEGIIVGLDERMGYGLRRRLYALGLMPSMKVKVLAKWGPIRISVYHFKIPIVENLALGKGVASRIYVMRYDKNSC